MANLQPRRSVFAKLLANKNSTITVKTSVNWVRDSETGILIPGEIQAIELEATLINDTQPNLRELPGVDEKNHFLSGYVVEPVPIPEGISHGDEATISINNALNQGDIRQGKCKIFFPIQNSYVSGKLGVYIMVELVED